MLPAIVVALSVPPARDVQPLAPEKHLAKLTTASDALCGDGDACDFDPKIAGLATATHCRVEATRGVPSWT